MKKTYLIFIIFAVMLSSFAAAERGHMTLLTVGERGNETFGGTADIYLEIKPGTGQVFIDSFPLTKIDTQISTRFAKEVACDFLEEDCSNKDFFYTIRAKSSIVGGPSAGAALTVLTIAMLEGDELDESVVMTGTINSGGIIGPVAGIEEKVEAAKKEGFKKVLIPKRSIISSELKNASYDIYNESNPGFNSSQTLNVSIIYSDSFKKEGIEIIPISTVEEALFYFTGKKYPDYSYDLKVPEQYDELMKNVSRGICERTEEIIPLIEEKTRVEFKEKYNSSQQFIKKAEEAFARKDYYSSASFCFNANKELREMEYSQYSDKELLLIAKEAEQDSAKMLDEVNKKTLKTLSELETSMVVKERLLEARDLLQDDNESQLIEDLPYVVERIHSAKAWSAFFDYQGKEMELDNGHLSEACLAKIAEAEERINYLELIFGEHEEFRKDLEDTRDIYSSGDYAFCLYKASRIKSDASSILSALSITEEKFPELLGDQLKLARTQINKQGEDFPIIGYSYYNYANSLRETRPEFALIYASYASEFSNLDMYFPNKKKSRIAVDNQQMGIFLIGFAAGIFAITLLLFITGAAKKKKALSEKKKSQKNAKAVRRKK
ncbi:MAG: S16 family serine protease [Candidatus Nanoarchaeia archaeon]